METVNKHEIKIDFYKGAYGPTIRIDVPSKKSLVYLQDTFKKLAGGLIHEFKFHGIPLIKLTNLGELNLMVNPKCSTKTVGGGGTDNDKFVFNWTNTVDGWTLCSELIEAMIEADTPCHQYLSEEGKDDALIELAYLES